MNKRLVVVSIIAVIVLAFVLAGQQKSPLTEQQIKFEIEKANYCNAKEDCTPVSYACPFDCNIFVNKKEVSKIETMLRTFVPTEQNLKRCSVMGACISATDVECKNNKCEAIYKARTGIYGTVTLTSGDCMPGEPSKTNPCTQTKISRTVYVREPATSANMDTVPNYNYLKTETKLVKQTVSDANGYYEAELPAGTYSVFVEDGGKEYCNSFGGQGEACQITLKDTGVLKELGLVKYDININKAVY